MQSDRNETVPRDVVCVEGVRRTFGTRQALAGVDLSLRGGEIYALIGPNGAGKTSLVRAICGRLRLDAGQVTILGADPHRDRQARRQIGLVPQTIALYPDLTARENLQVFGRLAGLPARQAATAADRALEWTGLADRARERVDALSGGMQRRINIAAGTLHEPRTLLLDEPTVGVDPVAREAIHEMLVDLRARGIAILLTTHDLDQASTLSDRVGVLSRGRLCAQGTRDELVRESFGDDKELVVVLAAVPDDRARAVLEAARLTGSTDARSWSGPISGLSALSPLSARLESAGAQVSETRVREPSLYGVFRRITGREFDE